MREIQMASHWVGRKVYYWVERSVLNLAGTRESKIQMALKKVEMRGTLMALKKVGWR